jgi:ATP-dependent Clp protease adaptor protein ClpS
MPTITFPEVETDTREHQRVKRLPPYHVVLHNDDDHSYDYVIRMLQELFNHPPEKGFLLADEVHKRGRVIVCTTSKERAELKQEQIHAYGPDPLIERCQGSMTSSIEPSE